MQNESQQNPEEEIPNMDQFQVGRAPAEEKQLDDDGNSNVTGTNAEENEYTPGEVEYADGEGTRLDEEIAGGDGPLTDAEVAGDDGAYDEDEDTDLSEDSDLDDDMGLEGQDLDEEEK
ncbi:hypothetical protein [Pedobacter yulinensis]|nr:hypothetical protein [Pedobacter yulinensis]